MEEIEKSIYESREDDTFMIVAKQNSSLIQASVIIISLMGWILTSIAVNMGLITSYILLVPAFFTVYLGIFAILMIGVKLVIDDGNVMVVSRAGKIKLLIPIKEITNISGYRPEDGIKVLNQRLDIIQGKKGRIQISLLLFKKRELQEILDEIERVNKNIEYYVRVPGGVGL